MEVYPAIDLMKGRAVRLYRGRRESVKVYGDPVKIAQGFSELVDKIHVVDLDGAFEGRPRNLEVVERIIEETGLRVQVGGGFRTYEAVGRAYEVGVENVILGTKALDTAFLERLTDEFGGITVSLDVKDGRIAVKGWVEEGSIKVRDAFEILRNYVNRFVYTSIERDGTLTGVDEIGRFWGDEEFIYAGGVSSAEDIVRLAERGFSGVIVGKALYEGVVKLEDLLEVAKCLRRG
ncbi:1-(5-phosphoribosyl)-5-[(5-phosphoribosylamino) methylideneamino] imidazole-4-carboxamide isomerase [Thermococcus kodakarensis KOD1]|uniref:1-(5-phosphoribosyl)-5-[(5-phosphoribosylamino)methylideneamino] imidazole-4-carboxamide isomerase n=1 Tax=Thermococcus kodakarensis (strain ATCC BAA-918 / JCM 12380 / KOD1) TaxID=69014 RepID=HIS4_THEKO|nr:1-(5-phosphoribosyl)-5-((5-phosphoribosylamino)methylideneamino)imidazole-4-carboxamide isomerase [Thermococcus kodakarensis]Q5JFU9.1 RecName: Full=1-(5-phosphoribosyl)-5-[(5-phosphoribosylamino)methylideneamino] imidazole-4-carboxamide isomerase; AltName: Full=Phosphoribosylformimino-5-aminoimidazole carboxamide ribotide isomerase [Thermococcus kodakarensis KOD1]WCN28334.1 1-(5-phosphoribosyl)-5-((5-phosphoribosylamino)methylideneamino)imidazole-4-carboxamide isomerase [Thermococcus kodakaren